MVKAIVKKCKLALNEDCRRLSMTVRSVSLVFCDESDCEGSWKPETKDVGVCLLCSKDLCVSHALPLTIVVCAKDLDAEFRLGVACWNCRRELADVLEGARNVLSERLKGLVTDCVRDYATRLKEEKGANKVKAQAVKQKLK